ncbi:hypothetical protein [Metabacillus fastidiosus]|uniref:hypothetical protein n=1 Tax=Metabacillus fastidiosus TaxID=1458 RepID=UPI003D275EB2
MEKTSINDLKFRAEYEDEFDSSVVKLLLDTIEQQQQENERLNDALKGAAVIANQASQKIIELQQELEESKEEKSFFVKAYTEKIMAED